MKYLLVFILSLLTSCGPDSGRFGNRIRGESMEEILDSMGAPDAQVEFPLTMDKMHEYRSGVLYHTTPQEKEKEVMIKEYRWKGLLSKRYVWFVKRQGQWIAKDGLVWNIGVNY